MCKKCLVSLLLFLAVAIFAFFFIFRSAARGATFGPIINEIAWAGSTASANDEWLELYNPSNETIALKGWKLEAADGSPSIVLKGELPSGGYFLLERTDDSSVPTIKANQIYAGSLDNGGEDLKIIDSDGVVHDEIDASQGWPAGDNKTKATMARDDTNLNVVRWGNGPINGTPLAQNILISSTPKEPPAQPQTETLSPISPKPTEASKKPVALVQPQKNKQNSATPNAANVAAFNARVQQEAQSSPSQTTGIKNIAGALALLAIGALATFTIIKKRKKDA